MYTKAKQNLNIFHNNLMNKIAQKSKCNCTKADTCMNENIFFFYETKKQ